MAQAFEPDHRRPGIAPKYQPASHYRLLGLEEFEADPQVIADAAERQLAHVRRYELGEYAELSQQILNELSWAKLVLLDTERKAAYDAQLRAARSAPPPAPYPQSPSPGVLLPVQAPAGLPLPQFALKADHPPRKRSVLPMALHIVAAIAGLAAGYLILCYLGPQYDFLGLMNRAAEHEQTAVELAVLPSSPSADRQVLAPPADSAGRPAPSPLVVASAAPVPVQLPLVGSRAGETWNDNGLNMTFVWCPPGTFIMGSPANEPDRRDDEQQVSVTLSHGFWLGQTEVTQGQWRAVMGTEPWKGENYETNGSTFAVTWMSWEYAMSFCQQLTEKERAAGRLPPGWLYTLPTEAQWEYACRAGTTTRYHFGEDEAALSQYAWYGQRHAREVKRKRPNDWGLYDMYGNVYEWCLDWYGKQLAGGTDPAGPASGTSRIMRGGGWHDNASYCRSAHRWTGGRNFPSHRNGFRVALVPLKASHPSAVTMVSPRQTMPGAPTSTAVPAGPSPLDALRRGSIEPSKLGAAIGGGSSKATAGLVAVLGTSRFKHWSYVTSVAVSPDGKTIVSGSGDSTIKLWNAGTGEEWRTLTGHAGAVTSVGFSPDGKTIVSGSDDHTIKLWNVDVGTPPRTLTGHASTVSSVAFSPDGTAIVSGGSDHAIKLWDAATGELRHTLTGHTSGVSSAAFSPDGKTLVSGSNDKTIKLWDAATGEPRHTLAGHTSFVRAVAFSPDGKVVVSGSNDNTIKLWDANTGEEVRTLTGHTGSVSSVAFNPGGEGIVSSSADKTIKLWDASTGEQRHTLTGHAGTVSSVAFSPDGKTIASGSADRTIKLWNADTGQQRPGVSAPKSYIHMVSFSPDGKVVASADFANAIRLWDAVTGEPRHTLTGHTSFVRAVAFSPDGKTIASGSGDKTIKLWDPATGALKSTLTGHAGSVSSVAFSADGKVIASASDDNTIMLWKAATGERWRTLTGHAGYGSSVAFGPDNGSIVAVRGKTIELAGAATGAQPLMLTGHTSLVSSVAFSPDGKTIASGSQDKTIKLWDTATGQQRRMLTGHTDYLSSVAFSPGGEILASSGRDGTVRLWSVADGQERATWQLGPSQGPISNIAFDPTGRYLATANANGTIYILRLLEFNGLRQAGMKVQPAPWASPSQTIIPADASRPDQTPSAEEFEKHYALKAAFYLDGAGFRWPRILAEFDQMVAVGDTKMVRFYDSKKAQWHPAVVPADYFMMNESGEAFAARSPNVVDKYQVRASSIVKTGTARLPSDAPLPRNAALRQVVASSNPSYGVYGDDYREPSCLFVVDFNTGRLVQRVDVRGLGNRFYFLGLIGKHKYVTFGDAKDAKVVDVESGRVHMELSSIDLKSGLVRECVGDRLGQRLLAHTGVYIDGSGPGMFECYDLERRRKLWEIDLRASGSGGPRRFIFSHNGDRVMLGRRHEIVVLDAASGVTVSRIPIRDYLLRFVETAQGDILALTTPSTRDIPGGPKPAPTLYIYSPSSE